MTHTKPDEHVVVEDIATPGPWWIAHEHPERPVDGWTVWAWSCDACVMHLVAAASLDPGHRADSTEVGMSTTQEALASCREWRAERGLREL